MTEQSELLAILLRQCNGIVGRYLGIVDRVPYQRHGVLTSEALAFCAMCDVFNIDLIIESGVASGRSTEIWARYSQQRQIVAVDSGQYYGADQLADTQRRLADCANLTFICGEAELVVPQIVAANHNRKIALFLDGPKGMQAVTLARHCFATGSHVAFVGIHDMCRQLYDHTMDVWESTVFYTDNRDFRQQFSGLDERDRTSLTCDGRAIDHKFPDGFVVGFAVNPHFAPPIAALEWRP